MEVLIRLHESLHGSGCCTSLRVLLNWVVPPVRSALRPQGLPNLCDSMVAKVSQGNSFCRWLAVIILYGLIRDWLSGLRTLSGRGSGFNLNGLTFMFRATAISGRSRFVLSVPSEKSPFGYLPAS